MSKNGKRLAALAATVLCTAPVVFFLRMLWERRWIGDDGLINTRVVNHILAGYGPVFNVGERVEAFTSPLWIAVLSLLGMLGVPPDVGAVYAGLLLSVAGMGFAVLACIGRGGDRSAGGRLLFPAGLAIYAALPPAWDYGTSGLENGLMTAWLAGMFAFSRRLSSRFGDGSLSKTRCAVYAILLSLGPLIRPEGALFSAAFFVALLQRGPAKPAEKQKRARRFPVRIVGYAAVCAILPVAYQLFRMGYYAALTANTALAKEAFVSNWTQGEFYFRNFFGLYALWIPLGGAAALFAGRFWGRGRAEGRSAAVDVALLVAGILYCVYVVKVGGDFMHGRVFLPGIWAMLLPVAAIPLDVFGSRLFHRIASGIVFAGILGWAVYCAGFVRMSVANWANIGDERGWYVRRAVNDNPVSVHDYRAFSSYTDGERLRNRAGKSCGKGDTPRACAPRLLLDVPGWGRLRDSPTELSVDADRVSPVAGLVVLRAGIGVVGTVAGPGVHIVDRFGLADPIGARLELAVRGRPGHEKAFSNRWLAARFAAQSEVSDQRTAAAARALSCKPLSEIIEAVRAPLTVERFFFNLVNAARFQGVRIPPNPIAAEQRFCSGS